MKLTRLTAEQLARKLDKEVRETIKKLEAKVNKDLGTKLTSKDLIDIRKMVAQVKKSIPEIPEFPEIPKQIDNSPEIKALGKTVDALKKELYNVANKPEAAIKEVNFDGINKDIEELEKRLMDALSKQGSKFFNNSALGGGLVTQQDNKTVIGNTKYMNFIGADVTPHPNNATIANVEITGGVKSVFGRTGDVIATEGDYLLDQLGDVTVIEPIDGQSLRWDTDAAVWRPSYSTSGLGIIQFSYRMDLPSDSTPNPRFVSRNTNDPTTATILYVNKYDNEGGEDLTLFLENIKEYDWLNLYLDDDTEVFEAYDVVSNAVLNGDVFEIGVVPYGNSTALLENRDNIRLFWRRVSQESYVEEAPFDSVLYGRKDGEWSQIDAEEVTYNSVTSNLAATDVQEAIDNLNIKVDEIESSISVQSAEVNTGRKFAIATWEQLTDPVLTNVAESQQGYLSAGVWVDVQSVNPSDFELRILMDGAVLIETGPLSRTEDAYVKFDNLALLNPLVGGEVFTLEIKSETVGTDIRVDANINKSFITLSTQNPSAEEPVPEAPFDSHTYGRKEGKWHTVPELIIAASNQEAQNKFPVQGDLFLNDETDTLSYAAATNNRKMLHFDNSVYGTLVNAPVVTSEDLGFLIYFQATIEPNLQIIVDHDPVGDTWSKNTRISIGANTGVIVFRFAGVSYTYNDPVNPTEIMSVAAVRKGNSVTFYRNGVAENIIGMTEFGKTSQIATIGNSVSNGNKLRNGRILALYFIDYETNLDVSLPLKSGNTDSEESAPAGITLNYTNVTSADWEDYTFDAATNTYTPVGAGEVLTIADGIEAQEVAFRELLTEVPVATETTFGGFKYTFVGGVLNLITE